MAAGAEQCDGDSGVHGSHRPELEGQFGQRIRFQATAPARRGELDGHLDQQKQHELLGRGSRQWHLLLPDSQLQLRRPLRLLAVIARVRGDGASRSTSKRLVRQPLYPAPEGARQLDACAGAPRARARSHPLSRFDGWTAAGRVSEIQVGDSWHRWEANTLVVETKRDRRAPERPMIRSESESSRDVVSPHISTPSRNGHRVPSFQDL